MYKKKKVHFSSHSASFQENKSKTNITPFLGLQRRVQFRTRRRSGQVLRHSHKQNRLQKQEKHQAAAGEQHKQREHDGNESSGRAHTARRSTRQSATTPPSHANAQHKRRQRQQQLLLLLLHRLEQIRHRGQE
jgi:hypothetical protein